MVLAHIPELEASSGLAYSGLEKTLESPLDCKEIQPVHSEGLPAKGSYRLWEAAPLEVTSHHLLIKGYSLELQPRSPDTGMASATSQASLPSLCCALHCPGLPLT